MVRFSGLFKSYAFYAVARTLVFRAAPHQAGDPSKTFSFLTFRFGFIRFLFFFIKSIWFSSLLFWAKRLYSSCVAPVSESWCKFLGTPSWPTSDHKTSILLKDFDVFSSKPQFYLRNLMFWASRPLLGSLAPPWEPLGSPRGLHLSICILWESLGYVLGAIWDPMGLNFGQSGSLLGSLL